MTWPTQVGGTGESSSRGITSLSDGSSIVIGEFSGTASFGDTTLTSAGGSDVFVAKLNADGSYAWATKAGGSSRCFGFGITSLSDGSSKSRALNRDQSWRKKWTPIKSLRSNRN